MVKKIIPKIPPIQPTRIYRSAILRTPSQALRSVTSKDGLGVYASSDTLFKGAIFGRDSLEVAEDVLGTKPSLVEKIILTLASLQGEVYNEEREEEPGKIIHEYRRSIVDGKPIDRSSRQIFELLSSLWGGDDLTMAYYGSIDATPLFIRVVFKYAERYGKRILDRKIKLRSGHTISLAIAVENSLDWLHKEIQSSKSGLLEFRKHNADGLANQAWKDSDEFYIHVNGRSANHSLPIASIEVQAVAYDALTLAAKVFPHKKELNTRLAQDLRQRTLDLLWLPRKRYFALGVDFSAKGKLRLIETATANPAEILDSSFFDDLPAAKQKLYVGSLTREIMGTDFLTDAGIRSRALSASNLVKHWDYHGSYTTWPKETYDIAKGLRRQGFDRLAIELENRLLNIVKVLKTYPEFVYVDYRGRLLGAATTPHHHAQTVAIDGTNRPERLQAWTVSAIYAISVRRRRSLLNRPLNNLRRRQTRPHSDWHYDLESQILGHIPLIKQLKTNRELSARYPSYPYKLKEM